MRNSYGYVAGISFALNDIYCVKCTCIKLIRLFSKRLVESHTLHQGYKAIIDDLA